MSHCHIKGEITRESVRDCIEELGSWYMIVSAVKEEMLSIFYAATLA